jgi:hypothetical protein
MVSIAEESNMWMEYEWYYIDRRNPTNSEEFAPTATSATLVKGPNPNGMYDIKCYLLLVSEAAL